MIDCLTISVHHATQLARPPRCLSVGVRQLLVFCYRVPCCLVARAPPDDRHSSLLYNDRDGDRPAEWLHAVDELSADGSSESSSGSDDDGNDDDGDVDKVV